MDINPLLFQTVLDSATKSANSTREAYVLSKKNATLDRIATAANLDTEIAMSENERLKRQLKGAQAALAAANATCLDWQAAMEAMRDLSQTLRDEIKACPNEEAHHFGKNTAARTAHVRAFEEKRRLELGLKPKYKI
jgi:hypothetical protein